MKRLPMFKDMDKKDLDLLTPLFEPFSCRAGTLVLEQGAPANYLYLVLNGKVQISYKPYDGATITVSHVEKNGLFGWSAVVGSDTYTSSAVAIEDLKSFRVRGSDLRKLCVEHPKAGREILERLANAVSSRWKDANEQVKSMLANGMNK